jgi:C_GCAxxG_C_C family probable redox protein
MTSLSESAASIFSQNYNCSQSVFSVFASHYELDEKVALKLASPFGGGVARRGELCGAVTGSLMTLGLAHGADKPAGKEDIYQLSQEFMHRFKEKHGSILCHDLIDCDLSTPAGHQAAVEKGAFRNICPLLVKDAVEILQAMLAPEL